jgi:CheY-like chemotaxis protein
MAQAAGMSLIRAVREMPRERGGGIPAVAVTGYARAEDKGAALAAGFQVHLAKAFEPTELVSAVAQLARDAGELGQKS